MTDTKTRLTPEQIESLGQELDALRERVVEDLGERDVRYIHKLIRTQRALEVGARGLLCVSVLPPVWAFTIIFCGHFPEATAEFSGEGTAEETRGDWYLRQMLGSANFTGGPLFHILSGNLGYQIEHHPYPDIPACRYREIAREVQEICERYGVSYNTGPLHSQFASVLRKILRLSLPARSAVAAPADAPVESGPAVLTAETKGSKRAAKRQPVGGRASTSPRAKAEPEATLRAGSGKRRAAGVGRELGG
jgi:fatty acid desaturase